MMESVLKGILVSGGLIIAVGSQNAFVIRQGLLKNHIFHVCLICFFGDFLLTIMGVMGLGSWINNSRTLTNLLALGGAVFLIYYGSTAFISAYKGDEILYVSNKSLENNAMTPARVSLATLAVTFLNPHVYLDMVFVIGGVAGTLDGDEKPAFVIGALLVSFTWFFGIGYGAGLLAPLFQKAVSWRIFNFITGCVMFFISANLIRYALVTGYP